LVFWRSFFALAPTLAYMAVRRQLGPALRTRYPHKHLIRGLLGCAVMTLSFITLKYLSVGLATALGYLAPILSVGAAVVFLRERPGGAILLGLVLGLAGIALMLFPALVGAEMRDGALIGVAAGIAMAATNALSRVQIKDLTRTDPPAGIALSFAVTCSVISLGSMAFGWVELDHRTALLLAGAGLFGGIGHVLMMEAVARAPVSVLAPYEYTGIMWAFMFDVVLLGVVLDAWAVTGALVVVVAAALVAIGQNQLALRPVRVD
jgi:drug/metabolite transporter (DMT)-like permease